jgi:hypothetical protein
MQEYITEPEEEPEDEQDDVQDGQVQDPLQADQPPIRQCIICFEERTVPHFILVPCGHGHSCATCQAVLVASGDSCPECRQEIRGTNPVFLD